MFSKSSDPFAIIRPCVTPLRFAFANTLIGPPEIHKLLQQVHKPLVTLYSVLSDFSR